MGFNHLFCGYDSVYRYVASMYQSQDCQLEAFVSFLQNTGLDVPLRELRWAEFARRYNGPKYEENRYDEKLEAAYLESLKNQNGNTKGNTATITTPITTCNGNPTVK